MINYKKATEIGLRQKELVVAKRLEKSREALRKLVHTRCTTIFIGALDSIEQQFGHKWGLDKNLVDLTENEKAWLCLWKEMRKEILDKGNNQKKLLLAELDFFDIILKNNYVECYDE